MRTASSSAGWPWSMTVRWPTGFMNAVRRPARWKPSNRPSDAVVLPRFWPVAARYSCFIESSGRRRDPKCSGSSRCLPFDQRDPVAEASDGFGIDGLRLEVGPEPIHDVGHEPQEHRRVRDEELRLVVVANERQPALEDAALLDMGDLGREVVALDAVRVVEEVQGVVDREAEASAPRDEAFVHLRRDPDLGNLVEDLGRDGQ